MIHIRFSSVTLALALAAAVFAPPAAGQASPDKDKVCSQIQDRTPPVGSWASYNSTGGRTNGSTMRMAVVGREPHEGTTYFWYEVRITDPQRPAAPTIVQLLVPGLGTKAGSVRSVVMKSGDQPAMRLPPQMIQMINSSPGMNVAADFARECQEMEVVGWELVTVPGGAFRALHLRHPRTATVKEAWVQPDLQFAMVRGILKDGGVMELAAQGTDAKSSITETPQEMPGLPR